MDFVISWYMFLFYNSCNVDRIFHSSSRIHIYWSPASAKDAVAHSEKPSPAFLTKSASALLVFRADPSLFSAFSFLLRGRSHGWRFSWERCGRKGWRIGRRVRRDRFRAFDLVTETHDFSGGADLCDVYVRASDDSVLVGIGVWVLTVVSLFAWNELVEIICME